MASCVFSTVSHPGNSNKEFPFPFVESFLLQFCRWFFEKISIDDSAIHGFRFHFVALNTPVNKSLSRYDQDSGGSLR